MDTHENSLTGPQEPDEGGQLDNNVPHGFKVVRKSHDIFGGENTGDGATQSLLFTLLKKAVSLAADAETREETETNSGISVGLKDHLIDKLSARELRDFNATHAISLDAKQASSVGLGHREQEIHETLDPLCRFSWQDTLDALGVDYWETGECFLECVYGDEDDRSIITGLHHVESAQCNIEIEEENASELYHYIVEGETGGAETLVMAKFGDLEDLKRRFGQPDKDVTEDPSGEDSPEGQELPAGSVGLDLALRNANDVVQAQTRGGNTLSGNIVNSEILHIRQATNRSRYYGYPDYMSAVPSIELVQCMTQHEFDFYFNRGVPEFMLFLLGKNIGKCWEKIESLIQANQGPGNSHKTGAVHIPGNPEETTVQVEKLAMESGSDDGFDKKSLSLDMRIATAHGMPPKLANIALPGRGSTNEDPNAMLIFQMRKLGQAQRNFSRMFACSLGNDEVKFAQPDGTPKAVSADLFLGKNQGPMDENGMPQFVQPGNGFNTILDGLTLGAAQTMSTMREPMGATDRNPEDGLLDGARDRQPGDRRQTRPAAGQGMSDSEKAAIGRRAPQEGNAEIGRNAPQG